jgi:hypothetical protein
MEVRNMRILFSLVCAFAVIAAASASLYGRENHIVTTGCLQTGADSNTYTLYTDSPGHHRDNQYPSEIARAEINPIRIYPEENKDLQRYLGHRTRIRGVLIYEGPALTGTAEANSAAPVAAGQYDLKVTSIHRIAGT